MNKFLFFLLFVAVSLGYVFEVDKLIAKNFNPFNGIKNFYLEKSIYLKDTIHQYFSQVDTIDKLQEENKKLRNYKLLYDISKNNLETLTNSLNINKHLNHKIVFTKVLSYVGFDDFTKVWLDFKMKDNQILGVISKEYAAGIVVNDNGKAKALLNGNPKANYTVFVGDIKAPGIIHGGKDAQYIVAKFVPIWYVIHVGDEVITSGMDNIFFEGLKVGKVIEIKKKQDMQEAIIKPYANVLQQKYFYIYKKEKAPEELKPTINKKEEKND